MEILRQLIVCELHSPVSRTLTGVRKQIWLRPNTKVTSLRNSRRTISSFQSVLQTDRKVTGPRFFDNAESAIDDLDDGAVVLSQGFGLCGVAETLIDAIQKKGTKNLTVVSNNAGTGAYGLAKLTAHGQISRMIVSFVGTNKGLTKSYHDGDVAIELCPQGTIVERLRAAGAGVPAFYTATGVNTLVETGQIPIRWSRKGSDGKQTIVEHGNPRETRIFNGRKYLMEEALHGDVAILRAWKVDEAGNCLFKSTTKNYALVMAKAARTTIVEAENFVKLGELDPDAVDLPGIFVNRVVPATSEKHIETLQLAPAATTTSTPTEPSGPQDVELIKRTRIAKRAAKELKHGSYVNLGVGIPTLAPSYLPPSVHVWLQSENGILGMGPYPKTEQEADPDTVNAGKQPVTLVPGAATFDSAESFGMIRGGHVDVSLLGALQVSAAGDLANYMIPGKVFNGMGGAMDLVSDPDRTKIVVVTYHTDKHNRSKIVQECDLPLTGRAVASTIITDMCVFQVDRANGGLTLTEIAEGVTVEQVRANTEATFTVAPKLKVME